MLLPLPLLLPLLLLLMPLLPLLRELFTVGCQKTSRADASTLASLWLQQVPHEEACLQNNTVLANTYLRRHVRAVAQRQELMVAAGREEKVGQLQRVRGKDVVVRNAVNQQKGPRQARSQRQQAAAVISSRVCRRMTQVALTVAGVVQAPFSDGSPCYRCMEHIRHLQHGQSSEVAAERPTDDTDSAIV